MRDIAPQDPALDAFRDLMAERDRRYGERFDAQERANGLALSAAEKAVLKAEAANERRFEGVNEFRATLADQAIHFATKDEVAAHISGLKTTLERLEKQDATSVGKGLGQTQLWGWIVGIIGIALAIYKTVGT